MRLDKLLVFLSAAAVAAAGCGGGSGGGGGGLGNAALDAAVPALAAELRSDSQELDPALLADPFDPIDNPNAPEEPFITGVQLGGDPDDGTTDLEVTVLVAVTRNPDGSGRVTTTVTNDATGFAFLTHDVVFDKPSISARVPPLGLAGLAADGTGQAFVIVRLVQTGTVTRDFANVDPGTGDTLVDFGVAPVPDARATAQFVVAEDLLVEYAIASGPNGHEAKIVDVRSGSGRSRLARAGGPAVTDVEHRVASLLVGGLDYDRDGGDVVIAVGPDADRARNVAVDASIALDVTIAGGVAGGTRETDLRDNITNEIDDSTLDAIAYTGALALPGDGELANGTIDESRRVRLETRTEETVPALAHSLDGELGAAGDLSEALYLPSRAERTTRFYLFR